MVDYAIHLCPDAELDASIRQKLQPEPAKSQSINQTMYSYLRQRPIAISIETKTADAAESTARVQLAIWVAAHFARLRKLSPSKMLPTLPLLYVAGSDWFLLFAVASADGEVVSSPTFLAPFCDTDVLGHRNCLVN